MGVDKIDAGNNDFSAGFAAGVAAARDEDFSSLDRPTRASAELTHVVEISESNTGFPAVSEEDLGHISPGCFVLVGLGESSYWVEIGMIEGVTISGVVHPELSSSLCLIDHNSCEVARFSRDQITALGCDRYCWC